MSDHSFVNNIELQLIILPAGSDGSDNYITGEGLHLLFQNIIYFFYICLCMHQFGFLLLWVDKEGYIHIYFADKQIIIIYRFLADMYQKTKLCQK